jgi:hypothetical protein
MLSGVEQVVELLMKKAALQNWHGLITEALQDARVELGNTAAAARIQVRLGGRVGWKCHGVRVTFESEIRRTPIFGCSVHR